MGAIEAVEKIYVFELVDPAAEAKIILARSRKKLLKNSRIEELR
jgi:hypothetical protein